MKPELVCCGCGEKWHRDGRSYESDDGFYVSCYPLVATFCPECLLDRMTDDKLVEFAASGNVATEIVQALLETDQPIEISADNRGKVIRAMYASDPAGCMDVIKEILHDQLPMEELIDWLNERKEVRKGA